jgi:hypothetical protein
MQLGAIRFKPHSQLTPRAPPSPLAHVLSLLYTFDLSSFQYP